MTMIMVKGVGVKVCAEKGGGWGGVYIRELVGRGVILEG